MAAGLVTIGRKQYASGLYWENSPSGRISQAAKEAAKQPGNQADYYVTRSGNKQGRVPQFGLVQAAEGFRAGIPSLAGCLANQQPGSWIGAFRLREGTALVVVRDDLIVPDGDRYFTDEAEARDHLYQEMAIGGFQRIYAPEAWGVPGSDTMPVTLLLNDRSDVRLHGVVLSQGAKTGLLAVFGVVFVVLGIGWYLQEQAAQEEAIRLEQLAAMERMKAEAANMIPGMQRKVEYPPPVRYWEQHPKPFEIFTACQKTFEKIKIGVGGWEIKSLSCSPKALDVAWGRLGGFSNPPPNTFVSDTGESASGSVAYDALSPRGDEQLVDPDVVTKRYLNQNWTGTIRRIPDDPPPPPPPNYNGEWNPPPPPWVKRSFTFTVPVLPWTLTTFLEGLPGVIVNSMVLVGNVAEGSSSWKIEGVIYENRR
ncbi:MAG TPA: hypothetical protein DCY07_08160 [Rhodospirillaceae bacterium]|nr:hypothetical protein [Rhodospirillaceae bacterium]